MAPTAMTTSKAGQKPSHYRPDRKRLAYLHNGRRHRLTDVAGHVLTRLLA